MRTKVLGIFLAALIIAACGKPDKQKELVSLRKQHDELSEKIKQLEDEIAASDTVNNTKKGTRVAVLNLKPSRFEHSIEVQGKVDGDESVNVFAEGLGGMIQQILVKDGQTVSKGQVLATLDDKIYLSTLKSNQSNLDFVTTMYNKQKALWEQKIGSEVQFLEIKTKKESLENAINSIKEQIDMCKIKSPINGTVEDIAVKAGSLVGPGIVAFRVLNLSSLKITANLAEGYSNRIKNGDNVALFLPDLKKELVGKIDFSSRFINPINRTFSVNVRIPSTDKMLKANMIVVLKITDYVNPKAFVAPVGLLQNDQEGTFIYVASTLGKNATARKVRVTTGEVYNGNVEVKTGLNEGDLLITSGYQELENGQFINF